MFKSPITCNNDRAETINAQAHQTLYFNLYFIIEFGITKDPTETSPLRESSSQTRKIHINCRLKERSRECTRGR